MTVYPSFADILAATDARRILGDPLPGGSAPYISADSFKINLSPKDTCAKSWDSYLSQEALRYSKSTLKAASALPKPAGTISLGTARPAPENYPWESLIMEIADLNHITDTGRLSKSSICCEKGEKGYDLGVALNYGHAAGSPQLLRFITEHIEMVHDPPYKDWDVSLTCSTTSAIEIVLRMLCDRGDSILVEEFTYPGTKEAAKAQGLGTIGVRMDEEGLSSDELDLILREWDVAKSDRPRLLYTIPTGQNPTGTTQTEDRRRDIYKVAERYGLIIVEDDPYYLVQLQGNSVAADSLETTSCRTPSMPRAQDYLSRLPSSYLSLDTSGRVLRLETASKILAPGLRCGWITGCTQLIKKFISFTEMSTVAPSGMSQVLLYKLLDEAWGHIGFFAWLDELSSRYRQKFRTLITACEEYLPGQFCDWKVPSAGMFLWVRIKDQGVFTTAASPTDDRQSMLEIEDLLYRSALERGVLISKGSWFSANLQSYGEIRFRLTFAAASDFELEEAIKRLGDMVSQVFR